MVKILIVEDSPFFRKGLAEALKSKFPGILIQEAGDGNEALKKVEEFVPNIILMDVRLPGENGLKLTQKIKEKYPGIIVIILTSLDYPEYRQAASQSGASCFLSKDSFDLMDIERCGKINLGKTRDSLSLTE